MVTLNNPTFYHGNYKKSNFFEGWYFKLTTMDNSRCISFIPGIALSNNKDSSHSFIQILDGNNKNFNYIKCAKNDFSSYKNPFKITINKNSFSLNNLSIDINKTDITIKSNIAFKNIKYWPDSIINPGSMGFYNYIPFMQCYSQVCALDGDLSGSLVINDEKINFDGGKLYVEKNWGNSFPLEWIWVQCNSFKDKRATLTCSLGKVPFLFKSFQGFLIGVTVDDRFYKFTTINRSKITLLLNDGIYISSINNNIKLTLKTNSNKDEFILCYGPKNGLMSPYVRESITSKIHMTLENIKTNEVIYEGYGVNVGIEYGGNFLYKQ